MLLRASAITGLSVLAQVLLAVGLSRAHGLEAAPLNIALLVGASGALGAAWAARQRLEGTKGESPAASAALVPLAATALFLGPRLAQGSLAAVLTAAAAAIVAPLVERATAAWLCPDDAERLPLRAALVASPLVGLGLATASPLFVPVGLLAGAFVAAHAALRVRVEEEEVAALVERIRAIEVRADVVACPPKVRLTTPALRALDAEIEARAEELAQETERDASARDEVADARALRTRFMAAMSHELRSPLNSIAGFAQVLERGLDGPLSSGQRESVSMIHRSADELISLLTDVLDLARLEAGRLRLERAWTPSVEILTASVTRGRALVEGRSVEISAELQPGLPPVHVDARRILQAVVALFRSATSSLRRTTIHVRARVANGPPGPARHLRVEIDRAIGALPEGEAARIFEAFHEITEPTGRRLGGLGMSLTLARGLVRLHGGEVWAEPSEGAGTRLCIAIPLDEAADGP